MGINLRAARPARAEAIPEQQVGRLLGVTSRQARRLPRSVPRPSRGGPVMITEDRYVEIAKGFLEKTRHKEAQWSECTGTTPMAGEAYDLDFANSKIRL